MQMKGVLGGFYSLCDWLMKLAYINILWIAFTFLGLIIFGLFPATTAMFVIIRKILMDKDELPITKTFLESYKREFLKSNLLGLILIISSYILYINISFLKSVTGPINLLYYPTLMIALGFFLTLFYVFPTFVHFDLRIHQVIKHAFLIMLMNPLSTALMVFGTFAVYLLMTTIPGLIPIFSASILSFVIMWSSFFAFSRIKKQQDAP